MEHGVKAVCKKFLRSLPNRYLLLFGTLFPIVVIELASFEVASWAWDLPFVQDSSISVLIVADPQIIGYKNEPGWIGPVTRWDSDRYLRRGYDKAVGRSAPDLELFMGDLFDEGVEMDSAEFESTMARFNTIFPSRDTCDVRCQKCIFYQPHNAIKPFRESVYQETTILAARVSPSTCI
jgi:Pyruvate/2-oxoacid:ferredoxin oxidoreductase delta subunit